MGLRLIILAVGLLCAWSIVIASVDVEPFIPLPARVKEADVIFAGVIVDENGIVPQAPSMVKAHRRVSIRPVFSLKGDLPPEIISLDYGITTVWFNEGKPDEPVGLLNQHTCPLFVVGAVYFLLLDRDGKADYRYVGAIEGNAYLDDPAGRARQDITQALQNAAIPAPAGWQVKLDAMISEARVAQQRLAEHIVIWSEKADGFALITGAPTLTFTTSQTKITPVSVPNDLGWEIKASSTMLGFHARDYVDMARQWHGIRHDQITWDGTAFGVAAGLLGIAEGEVTVHAVEHALIGTDSVVWVDGREGKAGLTTLQLAFAFSPQPLQAVALPPFAPDLLYIVPFRMSPGGDGRVAVACGSPVALTKNQVDRAWRSLRASASVINQRRNIVATLAEKAPADVELRRVEQSLGIKIGPGDEGRSTAAMYWSTVVQYEFADRIVRQILE